jgi:hypothetical protein
MPEGFGGPVIPCAATKRQIVHAPERLYSVPMARRPGACRLAPGTVSRSSLAGAATTPEAFDVDQPPSRCPACGAENPGSAPASLCFQNAAASICFQFRYGETLVGQPSVRRMVGPAPQARNLEPTHRGQPESLVQIGGWI